MISVIICSINPALLRQVTQNVEATIGLPFELIAVDNREACKGICQVYNEAAVKARYDILCFIHEDIIIKTDNWGPLLTEAFKDPHLGLIGIAGSSYRPLTPTSWAGTGLKNTVYKNIIQSFKFSNKANHHYYINPNNTKLSEVVCVDGVWLCTTKKVVTEIKFDQDTFKGFHLYDIDFSLAVAQKYRVAVTYDILVNHLSEGSFNNTWMEETLKLNLKWDSKLPIDRQGLTEKEKIKSEKQAFKRFIDQLIYFKFPMTVAFKVLWRNNSFFKLDPKLFFKLQYYILKKYLIGNNTTPETLL